MMNNVNWYNFNNIEMKERRQKMAWKLSKTWSIPSLFATASSVKARIRDRVQFYYWLRIRISFNKDSRRALGLTIDRGPRGN